LEHHDPALFAQTTITVDMGRMNSKKKNQRTEKQQTAAAKNWATWFSFYAHSFLLFSTRLVMVMMLQIIFFPSVLFLHIFALLNYFVQTVKQNRNYIYKPATLCHV
jgi:hypothetical protein